jgi:GMP synthase (glutamine-hydrolysing)
MAIKEITLEALDTERFISEQVQEIASTVGDGVAVNALSGGVDSAVATMLGHKALGDRLKTYFIDSGLMREGEPEHIVALFKGLGVPTELIDAQKTFFAELKGRIDPEDKREAITRSFYKDVFGKLVKETGATYLLQGTNYTDIEETVAGVKRQHNIRAPGPTQEIGDQKGRPGGRAAGGNLQPTAFSRAGPGRQGHR